MRKESNQKKKKHPLGTFLYGPKGFICVLYNIMSTPIRIVVPSSYYMYYIVVVQQYYYIILFSIIKHPSFFFLPFPSMRDNFFRTGREKTVPIQN